MGEAPGKEEAEKGQPFIGQSGQELTRMLEEAGLRREEVAITNVCHHRPDGNDITRFFLTKTQGKKAKAPEWAGKYYLPQIEEGLAALKETIESTEPEVIIPLGNVALWALTGEWGITAFRGSQMEFKGGAVGLSNPLIRVCPTLHPAYVMRQWDERVLAVMDLNRARTGPHHPPEHHFWVAYDWDKAVRHLDDLRWHAAREGHGIAADIEVYDGRISAFSFATAVSPEQRGLAGDVAFCIPMLDENGAPRWSATAEGELLLRIREILEHGYIVWQNGGFDSWWLHKEYGWNVRICEDTMVAQHAAYPGLKKGLGFLASLYLPWHRYWKEDKDKEYTPTDSLFQYAARDALNTLWVSRELHKAMGARQVKGIYYSMIDLYPTVLDMMKAGVRIDWDLRDQFRVKLEAEAEGAQQELNDLLGLELNVGSSKQMQEVFYGGLQCKRVVNPKTRKPTLDEGALKKIAEADPLMRPLVDQILKIRGTRKIISTYLDVEPSTDGRLRCTYTIGGAETGRFSSSKAPDKTGLNMENIPKEVWGCGIRKMYLPDEGCVVLDCDLDRADAQVVAAEAGDQLLIQMFREGVDIHTQNAKDLGVARPLAKAGVHATNYGASDTTLARTLGVTVHEAGQFIRRWFDVHPAIPEWHQRVWRQLQETRQISTRFGRTYTFTGRIDENTLREALAYVPQSTVADVTNVGMKAAHQYLVPRGGRAMIQVHDSVVYSVPQEGLGDHVRRVQELMRVPIDYDLPGPLIIGVGAQVGHNWGELAEWEELPEGFFEDAIATNPGESLVDTVAQQRREGDR